MTLHIDIETYSTADLTKTGVYRYVEDPDFEVLLFAVSEDDGPVVVYDIAQGEELPTYILDALKDASITKWAFNAQFERICLSRFLWDLGRLPRGTYLDPHGWRCDMIWSAYMGFPLSLAGAGAALHLDKQKLSEGKDLIRYFSIPCKPTKSNGGRRRNRPTDDPEKWETFKRYNARDVETEMEIAEKLSAHPVPEHVWQEYWTDQSINDRGILIDLPMVHQAIQLDAASQAHLNSALQQLTNLDNPRSVTQMKEWLSAQGMDMPSLGKKVISDALHTAPEPLRTVLTLRQQIAMSAVKKYTAMQTAACADGRCRGMFQFYGASRSGRYSGRIIQLQNLFRNSLPDLATARSLVSAGDYDALYALYDSVPEVLAQCVRTAFVPAPGYKFIVADYSAIEARVLAWLAGEQWVLDVFAEGGDIYCETAGRMFHCVVKKHGPNAELRMKGKQATLSCIAEGQLVLTDQGEIPIELVTTDMKVWDGEEWVKHDGVVYRGEREVITYEGLTATPDHLVLSAKGYAPFSVVAGDKAVVVGTRKVYDIRNAGRHHRFTVSGKLVHNCGYGGGAGALRAMGALEAGMKEDELDPLVKAWRQANPNIVKLWWAVDRAVKEAIKKKTTVSTHGLTFTFHGGMLYITLPSGRQLCYVRPRIGENKFGGESVTYMGLDGTKHWSRIESYGPKFVENCIAKGTLIITSEGLVPIEEILLDMLIWDGEEWISHDGLIYQGIQETILVNGIEMTPDHKILTEKGWKRSAESFGLNWAAVSLPDGFVQSEIHSVRKGSVAMQMREGSSCSSKTPEGPKVSREILRMDRRIVIQETRLPKPVYDIRNCGPRHRFAVWNGDQAMIVSNCVQAISRDILCHAMERLSDYRIVAHIHDEVIVEAPPEVTVDEICSIMGQAPPWAEGLVLRADGYECPYYQKSD